MKDTTTFTLYNCNVTWVPTIYAQYLYWYWYLKFRYWYLYWYLDHWYWYWYLFVEYLIQDWSLPSPRSLCFNRRHVCVFLFVCLLATSLKHYWSTSECNFIEKRCSTYRTDWGIRIIFDWRGPGWCPVKGTHCIILWLWWSCSHHCLRCVTCVVTKLTNNTYAAVNHLCNIQKKCFPALSVWPNVTLNSDDVKNDNYQCCNCCSVPCCVPQLCSLIWASYCMTYNTRIFIAFIRQEIHCVCISADSVCTTLKDDSFCNFREIIQATFQQFINSVNDAKFAHKYERLEFIL